MEQKFSQEEYSEETPFEGPSEALPRAKDEVQDDGEETDDDSA